MNRYITEFIGTFFLVFTVLLMITQHTMPLVTPLAIGLVLSVMVYSGSYLSGAHYNPVVSFSAYLIGKLSLRDLGPYILFQFMGGALAVLLLFSVRSDLFVEPLLLNIREVMIAEFLFTFALVYVIFNTAYNDATKGNSYYGFAIGSTVAAGIYAVGDISKGVFNPITLLPLVVMGAIPYSQMLYYIAIQMLAGVLAAIIFKMQTRSE